MRRFSLDPNSGLPPAASAFSRQRLANSPQCSAAGVIFAWRNQAHSKATQRCQIIGRAFVPIAGSRTAEAQMKQHAVVNKFHTSNRTIPNSREAVCATSSGIAIPGSR
jgi:hypothetical protein